MQGGNQQGVGGRQEDQHPPGGGGGYQDIYTKTRAGLPAAAGARRDPRTVDPRLLALAEMGMHQRWIHIASCIGMDNFLYLWDQLDHDLARGGNTIWLTMPRFSRFLRFQRNQIILQLCLDGLPSEAIQAQLRQQLGEDITVRHIDRLRSDLVKQKHTRELNI